VLFLCAFFACPKKAQKKGHPGQGIRVIFAFHMIIITHAAPGSLNASRLIIPYTPNHIPPTGNNAAEEYHYINPFAYRSIDKLSKSIASPDPKEVWGAVKGAVLGFLRIIVYSNIAQSLHFLTRSIMSVS